MLSALPSSAERMSSALRCMESLPSMPMAADEHHGQGVVVHVGGVAGHVDAAYDLAAVPCMGAAEQVQAWCVRQ